MSNHSRLVALVRSRAEQMGAGCAPDEIEVVRSAFPAMPGDYVAYLADIGWFTVSTHEVIGFGAGVPRHLDVIAVAMWERQQASPTMRPDLLPLENTGAGDHYCLDLGVRSNPVVFWSHDDPEGADQVPAIVAPSFLAWAVDLFQADRD